MRQLRFVALVEDGGHALLETTDGTERFFLPVEAALRDAVGSDLPGPAPVEEPVAASDPHPVGAPEPPAAEVAPPRPAAPLAVAPPAATPATPATPAAPPAPAVAAVPTAADAIGPREIQVRVRAGESPAELAAATGMSLERVMRFAGPVMDERLRIADEARRARARRSGEGSEPKIVMFGEAVDARFAAHGVEADSVTWDARRRDDGEWLVVASWGRGEATYEAEWLFSRVSRSVTPMDDTAVDLLSDRPIRPVAPPEPTRPVLVSAPALAPGVVAFPPMPDAHTSPLPVVEEVFDQEAAPEGPRPATPTPTRVPAPAAAAPAPLVPAASILTYDEPPLPLGITEPATSPRHLRKLGSTRRDESEDEKAARARIPSWDDILLGIRRKD